ncbi:transposase, partial [Rugamonas rubra]
MDTIIQPITTKAKRGPYRQHSDEFKRAAVARTLVAGASVSLIARELKINTNQLFSWRKRFGAETPVDGNALGRLMAVT